MARVGSAVKRGWVGLVLIAQCCALLAPLSDVHLPPQRPLTAATSSSHIDAPHSIPEHHDATTCVACIAQSLVALRAVVPVASPVPDTAVDPGDTAPRALHSLDPGNHHRPRGPPLSA